jgi:hypothetical protein
MAAALGVLAAGELTAWVALRGAMLVLFTAGVLAIGAALVAAMMSGAET